jgi:hypothetical protein
LAGESGTVLLVELVTDTVDEFGVLDVARDVLVVNTVLDDAVVLGAA